MPLLTWIVMVEPGTVSPDGEVPTTDPADDPLLTGVVCSATWKPASFSRCLARPSLMPATLGTRDPGAPSTYRGSVGGRDTVSGVNCFIAVNHVLAGSFPPNRSPDPHCRNGNEHNSPGAVESS
jgi:hypothetical protein